MSTRKRYVSAHPVRCTYSYTSTKTDNNLKKRRSRKQSRWSIYMLCDDNDASFFESYTCIYIKERSFNADSCWSRSLDRVVHHHHHSNRVCSRHCLIAAAFLVPKERAHR